MHAFVTRSATALALALVLAGCGRPAVDSQGADPRVVQARGTLAESEQATIAIFESASPSVVLVISRTAAGPFEEQIGAGTGFIWDEEGHVITNNHVVQAQQIAVRMPGGEDVPATVIGRAPQYDLAVLRLARAPNAPPLPIGTSSDLQVGQAVFAIGNPFGFDRTITSGIVSALGRQLPTQEGREIADVIQTDAAINPGNSGGALVDAAGNLVGINSAIYSRTGGSQGIGFAIPVSIARQVMEQIIRTGSVTRGWVGVEVQDMTPELAESFSLKSVEGALIAGVLKGGPADAGGVRPGDVLLAVNGRKVNNSAALLNLIAELKPGETAQLTVSRKQQSVDLKIQVGRRPGQRAAELEP